MKHYEAVKKRIEDVQIRLKPLQDQIKKWKNQLDKCQTAYKAKVRRIMIRGLRRST